MLTKDVLFLFLTKFSSLVVKGMFNESSLEI